MELVASSRIRTGGSADGRSGNGKQLALSLAQVCTVAGQQGVIAVRKRLDKAVRVGEAWQLR